jgi:ArsR family transcriptional regulator, virulence genes transcriptional regulator
MDGIDRPAIEQYRLHAELCRVLSDSTRLMVLDALRNGERSVGELATAIGVTMPNVSQHLAVMRGAGLVEGRRTGTTVIYRLTEPTIVEACDVIHRIVERRLASAFTPRTGSRATSPTDPTLSSVQG